MATGACAVTGAGPLVILHTADLHLGTPFTSVPEVGATLREEQSQVLRALAETVQDQQVDIVLLAGDIFDAPAPDSRWVSRFERALAEMAPAHVFICAGNHDPSGVTGFWDTISWPEHVHFFAPGGVGRVRLPELGVTVDGFSFDQLYAPEAFPTDRALASLPVDPEGSGDYRILVLHGDMADPSNYNPIRPDRYRGRYDYLALGHVHLPLEGSLDAEGALWRYPGAPQGRGFDETGVRGFWLGHVTKEAREGTRPYIRQAWTQLPMVQRPFIIREIALDGAQTESDVIAQMDQALDQWASEVAPDGIRARSVVLRIRLTGRPDLVEPLDTRHLTERMMQAGWFYVEIENHTKPAYDPDALRREPGFNHMLMEQVDQFQKEGRLDHDQATRVLDLILGVQAEVRDDLN